MGGTISTYVPVPTLCPLQNCTKLSGVLNKQTSLANWFNSDLAPFAGARRAPANDTGFSRALLKPAH